MYKSWSHQWDRVLLWQKVRVSVHNNPKFPRDQRRERSEVNGYIRQLTCFASYGKSCFITTQSSRATSGLISVRVQLTHKKNWNLAACCRGFARQQDPLGLFIWWWIMSQGIEPVTLGRRVSAPLLCPPLNIIVHLPFARDVFLFE